MISINHFAEMVKGSSSSEVSLSSLSSLSVSELIRRGTLRFEKCELKDAGIYFQLALDQAKEKRDFRGMSDSLAQLLRYSSEIGDEAGVAKWVSELEVFIAQSDGRLTPYTWYCKGIVAFRAHQFKKAQILFHRFWKEVEREENETPVDRMDLRQDQLRSKAQALLALALVAQAQGKPKRAQYFGEVILAYAERERPRGILASTYLMLCRLAEREYDTTTAKMWLQKAFAEAVSEHNWYHYLYVLYGFARVARIDQDYIQAGFYLGLLEKALVEDGFKNLRSEVTEERTRLQLNRVDLEIDLNRSLIKTREASVNLGRQHLLLDLMTELAKAHEAAGTDGKVGLSKQEIIEKVWKETYSTEDHDGKLYYNINRIRKLIEADPRNPQYLQNWRQGYRLAPELRIRVIEAGENGV